MTDRRFSRSAAPSEHYRADIDGLRAVAVLLVIIYHFDLVPITGGFVGVDVFFVISGFVITLAIMAGLNRGERFLYGTFLARRLLRLAPGAIVIALATLIAGWFTLSTSEYVSLGRSAVASVFFVANLYFSRRTGYFAQDAETQPLLHMWSLGVEEQFYLLAPLLIVGLASRPLVRSMMWVAVLGVSFALALRAGLNGNADAYFLLQYRAFELAIGVLLALHAAKLKSHAVAEVAGLLGLVIIVASAILIDSTTPFPGPWALAPCVGAALVIIAGNGRQVVVSRLLATAPFVFVGSISYTLYLWHWPLAAFAKIHFGTLGLASKLFLFGAVFLLAVLTHFGVERVVRRRAGTVRQGRWLAGTIGIGVASASFGALVAWTDVSKRLSPAVLAHEALGASMQSKPAPCQLDGNTLCLVGSRNAAPTFLLWGDSHAHSLGSEIDESAKRQDVKGVLLVEGGCPPLVGSVTDTDNPRRDKRCTAANQQLVRALDSYPTIERVILHARWATYTEPESRRRSVQLVKNDTVASRAVLAQSLAGTVDLLLKRGMTVTVIGPVPEYVDNPWTLQTRAMIRGADLQAVASLNVPIEDFRNKNRHVIETLGRLPQRAKLAIALPHEFLCSRTDCSAVEGRTPLYYDNNHLNWLGAQKLRPILSRAIGGAKI